MPCIMLRICSAMAGLDRICSAIPRICSAMLGGMAGLAEAEAWGKLVWAGMDLADGCALQSMEHECIMGAEHPTGREHQG